MCLQLLLLSQRTRTENYDIIVSDPSKLHYVISYFKDCYLGEYCLKVFGNRKLFAISKFQYQFNRNKFSIKCLNVFVLIINLCQSLSLSTSEFQSIFSSSLFLLEQFTHKHISVHKRCSLYIYIFFGYTQFSLGTPSFKTTLAQLSYSIRNKRIFRHSRMV